MSLKNRMIASAAAAGLALASQALAGFYQEPGGFGVTVGMAETFSSGFGTFGDGAGRTIASAISTGTVAPDPAGLTEIRPRLWLNVDADVYKFRITDSAGFKAFLSNTAVPPAGDANAALYLFNSAGVALAAARGLPAAAPSPGFEISEASTGLSLPVGEYYVALAQTDARTTGAPYPTPQIGIPTNLTGQQMFDFTTNGVKLPIAGLTDYNLSTDAIRSFVIRFSDTAPLGGSTFTSPTSATIQLRGADYIFVPEPSALAAFGLVSAVLLRRR